MERYERRVADRKLQDHVTDEYAHNESWSRQRRPYIDGRIEQLLEMLVGRDGEGGYADRLTKLEKFQEQVKGAGVVIGAMVGGGIITLIAHLVKLI